MGKLRRELESWGGTGGSGCLLLWVIGYTPLIQEPPPRKIFLGLLYPQFYYIMRALLVLVITPPGKREVSKIAAGTKEKEERE